MVDEMLPSIVLQSDIIGRAIVIVFEGSVVAFVTNVAS